MPHLLQHRPKCPRNIGHKDRLIPFSLRHRMIPCQRNKLPRPPNLCHGSRIGMDHHLRPLHHLWHPLLHPKNHSRPPSFPLRPKNHPHRGVRKPPPPVKSLHTDRIFLQLHFVHPVRTNLAQQSLPKRRRSHGNLFPQHDRRITPVPLKPDLGHHRRIFLGVFLGVFLGFGLMRKRCHPKPEWQAENQKNRHSGTLHKVPAHRYHKPKQTLAIRNGSILFHT